jgi:hypothetical protein
MQMFYDDTKWITEERRSWDEHPLRFLTTQKGASRARRLIQHSLNFQKKVATVYASHSVHENGERLTKEIISKVRKILHRNHVEYQSLLKGARQHVVQTMWIKDA